MLATMGPLFKRQLQEAERRRAKEAAAAASKVSVKARPVPPPLPNVVPMASEPPPHAVRLVAWPGDVAPRGVVLSAFERSRLSSALASRASRGRAPLDPPPVEVRLVAAPDGVYVPRHPPDVSFIGQVRRTAAEVGLTVAELLGPGRRPDLVVARAELAWLGAVHYGHSLPLIGRLMGQRDHTTILNCRRRVDAALADAGITDRIAARDLSSAERRDIIRAFLARPQSWNLKR